MDLGGYLKDLPETLAGKGPAARPARRSWVRRYRPPVTLTLTALTAVVTWASVPETSGAPSRLLAVAGVLPLAILLARPLVAWRVGYVVGLLSYLFPTGDENSVDGSSVWNPTQIVIYVLVLFIVSTGPRTGVTIWTWALTVAMVLPAGDVGSPAGIAFVTLIVIIGDQVGRRRRAQRDLGEQEERSAILAERARIARDMHDVVAHHMSMIAVRAETAPYRVSGLADEAVREFRQLSEAAREALMDLRQILGVLRSESPESPIAPQPSLADLPDLVEAVSRAGTTVELEVAPGGATLPGTLQLSAYRIIQESLSNAIRHAPGTAVSITLERTPDTVVVTVRNPVPERGRPGEGTGQGIRGMRERVGMLGGTLTAGPTEDGSFVVRATVPATPTAGGVA